jgi:hypothetical protein
MKNLYKNLRRNPPIGWHSTWVGQYSTKTQIIEYNWKQERFDLSRTFCENHKLKT